MIINIITFIEMSFYIILNSMIFQNIWIIIKTFSSFLNFNIYYTIFSVINNFNTKLIEQIKKKNIKKDNTKIWIE